MKVIKNLAQASANPIKSERKQDNLKPNSWFSGDSIKYHNISCENLIIKLKELASTRAGMTIESDLLQMLQMPPKYKFDAGDLDNVEIKFIESDSKDANKIMADSASMAHIANKMAEHVCDRFNEHDTRLLLKYATDPKFINALKSHLQELLNAAFSNNVDHNNDNNKSSVNLVPNVGKNAAAERLEAELGRSNEAREKARERKHQLESQGK